MRTFLLAVVATIITFLLMRWQGASLITPSTPTGILALEFCKSLEKLNKVLSAWSANVARWNIIIDFLFLAAYGAVFYFGAVLIAARLERTKLKTVARRMISFSLFAPVLDVIENTAMLVTLSGERSSRLLQITSYVAWLKFACAAVIVLYLLVSLPLNYAVSKKEPLPG